MCKTQLLPPSDDSNSARLLDNAAENDPNADDMPIEYFQPEMTGYKKEENIFDRLYKESELKNRRRENLVRSGSQSSFDRSRPTKRVRSTSSQGNLDHLKIEDKLMHKHINSLLKLDQKRRERQSQESEVLQAKPVLNQVSVEMMKNSKNVYVRQKEFVNKKQVNYEVKKKEQELRAMKEFTGSPKINERSKKMSNSNISQLTKPIKPYTKL
jgi:hypothetical protein